MSCFINNIPLKYIQNFLIRKCIDKLPPNSYESLYSSYALLISMKNHKKNTRSEKMRYEKVAENIAYVIYWDSKDRVYTHIPKASKYIIS